ncbi:tetratricopeptide repeat protein [Tunturiibacter lichenicola]|uniref:tetratricopeptide repeat protein n=1 Tax=Tunturiibacter lichenicola TaxID=2051959 RepID=UPI003D9B58AE
MTIKHDDGSSPPTFTLIRLPDGRSALPVVIPSPYDFPVEGQPNSDLMRELRWYLEKFLNYPFDPETVHAEHVLAALRAWGTAAFNALFDRRDTSNWLAASNMVQVRSDDARMLSWPWEALFDPQSGYLAHARRIERRLNRIPDPPPMADLPRDRVNVLLVVARPYENDVHYRSIARPLIEMIQSKELPVHVDVLRPPTFDRLRDQLRAKPGYYHVLHFDGHGAYDKGLIFENDTGEPDAKSARDLSALLREYALPAVVLNACQAGMLDTKGEDAFASVATALLQSGMRSIVAMAYSLYVSGAQVFLPAFYRRLFEEGSVAEAVRAGRQEMLAHKGRVCVRGKYPLEDWLLPVLYQQDPQDFRFAAQAKVEAAESRLPAEVREHRDAYGFVGRDGAILEMERALHRKAPAFLLQGLGGVGKTTLARGFLRWLDDTGGLDGALWLDFRDIHSAEYVIQRTGEMFYGQSFGVASNKIELLARSLGESRTLMVWDNFESAATNLSREDHTELGRFLDAIRGGRGKVLITSRSREEWLGPSRRFELKLHGLDGEERWEYCEAILRELGLKVNRNDPALSGLIDQLAGHPLAMRAVLPRLEDMVPASVAEALRSNIDELGLSEQEEQVQIFATLRFVEQGLAEELRPLLQGAGLYEEYVDADSLAAMGKRMDGGWTPQRIGQFLEALGAAGLLRAGGAGVYEMHPLLTSFLRSQRSATESWRKAFVEVLTARVNALVQRPYHEQRDAFARDGANFHFALTLARQLSMDESVLALTQALGAYAVHSRNFGEAKRLFGEMAVHAATLCEVRAEISAYHELGIIAQEQREFETARDWYLKVLTISERSGNDRATAITYHHLGMMAQKLGDPAAAQAWYLKSVKAKEKLHDHRGLAAVYHSLGMLALEQDDPAGAAAAAESYGRSLALFRQVGDQRGISLVLHGMGMVSERVKDPVMARQCYLDSLKLKEKLGDEHGAASSLHQLGILAESQKDDDEARDWYFKALKIKEKLGDLNHAAMTYGQLGIIASRKHRLEEAGKWLVRAIAAYRRTNDRQGAERNERNFYSFHQHASPEDKQKLEAVWRGAALGDFPKEPNQ